MNKFQIPDSGVHGNIINIDGKDYEYEGIASTSSLGEDDSNPQIRFGKELAKEALKRLPKSSDLYNVIDYKVNNNDFPIIIDFNSPLDTFIGIGWRFI